MKIVCIIPARYASTRLPGKPLADLAGSPMIEWVYRRACAVRIFDEVIIATDDERIAAVVQKFGGKIEMTAREVLTGTDRVALVAETINADIIVNLQGDEPLISPGLLEEFCLPYSEDEVVMTTPIRRIINPEELTDPTLARVVVDNRGDALYFSRSTIPFVRDVKEMKDWLDNNTFYRHIGLYSYRKDFLLNLASLEPGRLERLEQLEQLRVLEHGYKIRTVLTDYNSISVDTVEDLNFLDKYIRSHKLQVDKIHEYM
jgi:3-deoxy-manno-octulosonate cytidylyltransferase (CMP-KDO synthetase)